MLGLALDASKDAREDVEQFRFVGEISVVRTHEARVVPQSLGRIEFGPVGRKVMYFPPRAIRLEPGPHILVFVVGCVVLDVNDRTWVIIPGDPLKKVEIGVRVEYRFSMVQKASGVQLHASEYLDASAGTGRGDLGRAAASRPRAIQRRVLAKTDLVLVDQRGACRPGFFLMEGYR